MSDAKLCPNCGQPVETGRAICGNCNSPITAYGGQVGQEENFQRRLVTQVQALDTRPQAVTAMVVFDLLLALVWPLRGIFASFASRPHLNAENTNYIGAALGSIGPLFTTIVLLPVTVALCALAYFTWTQRSWAWIAGPVVLGIAVVTSLLQHGMGLLTICWIVAAAVIAWLWFRPGTKSWFGYT